MVDFFEEWGMGIHHVAISVADLEETILWYKDKLGFSLITRTVIPGKEYFFNKVHNDLVRRV